MPLKSFRSTNSPLKRKLSGPASLTRDAVEHLCNHHKAHCSRCCFLGLECRQRVCRFFHWYLQCRGYSFITLDSQEKVCVSLKESLSRWGLEYAIDFGLSPSFTSFLFSCDALRKCNTVCFASVPKKKF